MIDDKHSPPPEKRIPLAERTFPKPTVSKGVLVIQYVTEGGTGKTYFRFVSPQKIEGFAGTAEEAEQRARALAAELKLEIHPDIMHVTT